MPIEPKIPKSKTFFLKKCAQCGVGSGAESFSQTHSIFYPDGYLPICNSCITEYLEKNDFGWKFVDKVCQWADIPFIVKEWERLSEQNAPENRFSTYAKVFATSEYINLGWEDYNSQYKKLKEVGLIEDEIPLARDEKLRKLRERWGANYEDEELLYLENLYKGLSQTQNVNGALQVDQAKKICKLSLEIDSSIRAGGKEVDKLLGSYDKLVKTAEFTPKNAKNAADFDSVGELCAYLEKSGRINKFYDRATRDVLDETLKNMENYNQRLYINEGGIGEEITNRLESLKIAKDEENFYNIQSDFNTDEYDNEGYEDIDDSSFDPTGGQV